MKKLKLPLEMANGKQVRSLQELRDNWDLEKVLGYYLNGRLAKWLNDRYYAEEAEKIQQLGGFENTKVRNSRKVIQFNNFRFRFSMSSILISSMSRQ